MLDNHDQQEHLSPEETPDTIDGHNGKSTQNSFGKGALIAFVIVVLSFIVNKFIISNNLVSGSSMNTIWFAESLIPGLASIYYFITDKRNVAKGLLGIYLIPLLLIMLGMLLFGACMIIIGIGGGLKR
jgi:hypothetical protein